MVTACPGSKPTSLKCFARLFFLNILLFFPSNQSLLPHCFDPGNIIILLHSKSQTFHFSIPSPHIEQRTNSPSIIMEQPIQQEIDWSTIVERKSPLRDRLESLSRITPSSASPFSEEEVKSIDGFESGFETFNDFLNYSSPSLPLDENSNSKRKLKRRLRNLLRRKTYKRLSKSIGSVVQNVVNACAILLRGVLFVAVNITIVLAVIISLAI